MAKRKCILATGEIYHIFNRGVARQPIFRDRRDYTRLTELLDYYRFQKPPLRFSHYHRLPKNQKHIFNNNLSKNNTTLVEIMVYCFMPNHFHLLIKQIRDKGIERFMANLQNSYARFFNIKHERVGPLFQSNFKAVRIETDEQLLHVSRYIHLNPITSYLIKTDQLEKYVWSSLPHYLGITKKLFLSPSTVLGQFKNPSSYRKFVLDQVDYQQQLHVIKYLILEK